MIARWMHAFIDVPTELVEVTSTFWAAVSGAVVEAPWPGHDEFRALRPATGSWYLHVQGHGGPPRLHPDLTTADIDAETARLVNLGATARVRERWWQVLTSPGGLPFCLVDETPGRSAPGPTSWPGGHRSRVARLVLTVPARSCGSEWAFWGATTGWPSRQERLLPPDSSPLGLLLCPQDRDGPVRAHPDIDTDDVPAEVRRVVALGAGVTAEQVSDVALVDPVGIPFRVVDARPAGV